MSPTLPESVVRALEDPTAGGLDRALGLVAEAFGAVTATLHRADPEARVLEMVASRGLPEKLVAVTARIPFGKGMAGICAERREIITVCNLQTDESGQVRPGAKLTGVEGAITVPIFSEGGELAGALGIGKIGEHDYDDAEQGVLVECARAIAPALSKSAT
jgi:L-methionine (R)-S-oxide reductase